VSLLEIVRLGHPALREKSQRVSRANLGKPDFQVFLDDLAETCVAGNGVGIAAPQVGVNLRVIVVHVDPTNPRYPDKRAFPLTLVINPRITQRSVERSEDWEGDMSAGIRGLVPRAIQCVVVGLDRSGKPISFKLDYDFHARVFQHEIDHLNGKFFTDRMRRRDSLTEVAEWEKYWRNS
jgi:peptide deformylase